MNNVTVVPLSVFDNSIEVHELFMQLTSKITNSNVKFLVDSKDCYCAVVRQEGRLIAFGALSMYLIPEKGYVGTIQSVIVDKNYRKQGLGTALMIHLIAKGRELQLPQIDLTSNPSRKIARQIYTNLGFTLLNTGVFRLEL